MSNRREVLEVTGAESVKLGEVTQICEEFKEIPMADILVEVFLEHADPESFRIGKDFTGKEILANPKRKGFDASLKLSQCHDRVDLEIFDGSTEMFPTEDLNKRWCCTIAILHAGQKETGTWAYGSGYEQTYGIRARFISDLLLPSERAKWVFEVFEEIARKTNEQYSLNQPSFYSDETIPEPVRA